MYRTNRVTRTVWEVLLAFVTAFTLAPGAFADEKPRVAVFDPATTSKAIDSDTRVAVRELICSALVNSGEYNILERAMLDKVMKESKFNNSAAVDETQATELGKLAGANKVVLPVLSKVGGKIMLSVKLIDVTTASVELQKAKVTDSANLLADVEPLTAAMLGQESATQTARSSRPSGKVEAKHDTVAVLEDFINQLCAIYNIELGVTTISELEQRFNKKANHQTWEIPFAWNKWEKFKFNVIRLGKKGFTEILTASPIAKEAINSILILFRGSKDKHFEDLPFPHLKNGDSIMSWASSWSEWNNWFNAQGFKFQPYNHTWKYPTILTYNIPNYRIVFQFYGKGNRTDLMRLRIEQWDDASTK